MAGCSDRWRRSDHSQLLLRLLRQRSLRGPPSTESPRQQSACEAQVALPLCKAFRHPTKSDSNIPRRVARLLSLGCPPTVWRAPSRAALIAVGAATLIPACSVDTVNRMLQRRPVPHVSHKGKKVASPTVTHANAFRPVQQKSWRLAIVTASSGALPDHVQRVHPVALAEDSVLALKGRSRLQRKTSTRPGLPSPQRRPRDQGSPSAVTHAAPSHFAAPSGLTSACNSKFSELLIDEVDYPRRRSLLREAPTRGRIPAQQRSRPDD